MIKKLLISAIAKYRDLSMSRRSVICLNLRLPQTIDLLATDKSQYFAQPRPTIDDQSDQIISGCSKPSLALAIVSNNKLQYIRKGFQKKEPFLLLLTNIHCRGREQNNYLQQNNFAPLCA